MASGEKISVTWIEAALFVFLVVIVMSLVSSLDEVIGSIRESRQPKLDTFNRQAQVPALQLDAVSAQAELTGLQTELAEQQAELVKQAAKVESLREAHPALMAGKDGSAPGLITTSEVTASFDQAQLDYAVTLKVLDELRKHLPQAKATAIIKASVLLDALDSAKASFDDAQRTFTR